MSDLLSPEIETERATKPPTRWRNWWRGFVEYFDGTTNGPGVYCGPRVHPSKEVAEQAAIDWLARHEWTQNEYLGAYPEGETP